MKDFRPVADIEAENNRMKWLLKEMLDCLPQNRDFLNPEIEREAKSFASMWQPDILFNPSADGLWFKNPVTGVYE